MSLRRSASGLLSLPIFFAVDVVVFCEGGGPLTITQATAHEPSPLSFDMIFWRRVVDLYNDTRKFHFKSVGSKTTLASIASDVERHNINNITICLDSDYDRVLGRLMPYRRVAYTFGYSWENDVLSEVACMAVLTVLIGPPAPSVMDKLNQARANIENELAPWCETDISLLKKGKTGVFDRSKPLSCVDITQSPPRLRAAALRTRLTQSGYVRRPRRTIPIDPKSAAVVTCGKLIARIYYHLIVGIAKRVDPKVNLDFGNFMRIAIAQTFDAVRAGQLPALANHYALSANAF